MIKRADKTTNFWMLAPPDLGSSINPTSTKGADYAHQIILATPDFQTFRRPWIVSHSRNVFKKSKNFHKVDQLDSFLFFFLSKNNLIG